MRQACVITIGLCFCCTQRAGRVEALASTPARAPKYLSVNVAAPRVAPESRTQWSIRVFPQVSLSVALPRDGDELSAKDLRQLQASLAIGVRAPGADRPTYILLAFPISGALQRASLEQRLVLLPYLLGDLGPESPRVPVDLDGLAGVEFVTKTDAGFQRARVFATPTKVLALLVRASDQDQTTDRDARLFFESLQWYGE